MAQNETKLASYYNTPFTELCLGMTQNNAINWILVNYTANSLFSVIADEKYHKTNAGRAEWMSLINGAFFQQHCNREGFNIKFSAHNLKLRIGIAGNNENHCYTCDSVFGFGFQIKNLEWSSGNIQVYPETKKLKIFGYIFVQ